MGMGTCRGCGAPIRWEKTNFGKAMPLDLEPLKVGILERDPATSEERVRIVTAYTPHWATCPKADQFKKKGA